MMATVLLHRRMERIFERVFFKNNGIARVLLLDFFLEISGLTLRESSVPDMVLDRGAKKAGTVFYPEHDLHPVCCHACIMETCAARHVQDFDGK